MGYSNRTWVCPFFRWDAKQKVYCEGGSVTFKDKGTFRRYVNQFCGGRYWEQCTLAAALIKQYEERDDGKNDKS